MESEVCNQTAGSDANGSSGEDAGDSLGADVAKSHRHLQVLGRSVDLPKVYALRCDSLFSQEAPTSQDARFVSVFLGRDHHVADLSSPYWASLRNLDRSVIAGTLVFTSAVPSGLTVDSVTPVSALSDPITVTFGFRLSVIGMDDDGIYPDTCHNQSVFGRAALGALCPYMGFVNVASAVNVPCVSCPAEAAEFAVTVSGYVCTIVLDGPTVGEGPRAPLPKTLCRMIFIRGKRRGRLPSPLLFLRLRISPGCTSIVVEFDRSVPAGLTQRVKRRGDGVRQSQGTDCGVCDQRQRWTGLLHLYR